VAWTWSLNWGVITAEIAVGTCPLGRRDLERIRDEAEVSAVLSLQHDECLAHWHIDYTEMARKGRQLGLVMARCPIRDFDPAEMQRCLPEAIRSLARLREGGHHTYVHCTAGISRAPLTVFGYLTLVEGLPSDRAREIVMEGRPQSVPYWEAYEKARADLVARLGDMIRRHAADLQRLGRAAGTRDALEQAEAEILREVLSGDGLGIHLDKPHRRPRRKPR
jgi:hypothetical protein